MFHRQFSQDIKLKQFITSQHSMRLHMPASHDCRGKHELPERERGYFEYYIAGKQRLRKPRVQKELPLSLWAELKFK